MNQENEDSSVHYREREYFPDIETAEADNEEAMATITSQDGRRSSDSNNNDTTGNNEVGDVERAYHRPNSSNLVQDEQLMQEVRKYPCLYDRCHDDYKKPERMTDAWKRICEICNWIKNPDEASRLFEVLKKRYSKKKMDYKRAHLSPEATALVKKTHAQLKKYQFMNWMEPYIRFRSVKLTDETGDQLSPTTTNSNKTPESKQLTDEMKVAKTDEYLYVQNSETMRRRHYDHHTFSYPEVSHEIHTVYNNNQRNALSNEFGHSETPSQHRLVSSSTGLNKQHRQKIYYEDSKRRKLSPMQSGNQAAYNGTSSKDGLTSPFTVRSVSTDEGNSNNDSIFDEAPPNAITCADPKPTVYHTKLLKNDDELFSAMITSELSKLDERKKYIVKHKMSNVLFDAMIEHYEDSSSSSK